MSDDFEIPGEWIDVTMGFVEDEPHFITRALEDRVNNIKNAIKFLRNGGAGELPKWNKVELAWAGAVLQDHPPAHMMPTPASVANTLEISTNRPPGIGPSFGPEGYDISEERREELIEAARNDGKTAYALYFYGRDFGCLDYEKIEELL